jgi:parallel beta-helix repeat protein
MNKKLTSILFFAVICLIGITLAIAQPVPAGMANETHNITIATPVQDTARIDTSLDSCRNSTTPIIISGYVTYRVNNDPVSNPTVMITNLNTSENFVVNTNSTSNYYQTPIISTNVSAGDRIRFNTSDGIRCNETVHVITTTDMERGGFLQKIQIELEKPYPDLKITNCSVNVVSLENKTINITYTVENVGDKNADASITTIYVDGSPALDNPVRSLAPGENCTGTVGPLDFPHNSVRIMACADNGSVVDEFNEANNCMEARLKCPLPNMGVAHFPLWGWDDMANGRYYICYRIRNHASSYAGPSNTSINITTVWNNGSASSVIIKERTPAVEPHQRHTSVAGHYTCPCNCTIMIKVCADVDKEVLESNESDNCHGPPYHWNPGQVSFVCPASACGKPDLKITNCSAEWIDRINFTLGVLYTVANIGNGDANASTTRILTADDPVPALAPGKNYTSTVFPLHGSGTINFYADWYDDVRESNEDNNRSSCNIGAGGVPYLRSFYINPIEWIDGINKTYNVHYSLGNWGGSPTTNKTIAYFYIDGTPSGVDNESLAGILPRWASFRRFSYGPFTMSGTNDTVKICVEWEGGRICKEQLFKWGGCMANDGTRLFVCNDVIDRDCTFVADLDCRRCITGEMFPKGILIGPGAHDITIDGNGYTILGEVNEPGHFMSGCYYSGISVGRKNIRNVTIKNLEIREFCTGISITGVDNIRIENCLIHENGDDRQHINPPMTTPKPNNGISVENSDHVMINNCIVYNNTGDIARNYVNTAHGINVHGNNCTVTNSSIYSNNLSGIYASPACEYLGIINNRIEDNGRYDNSIPRAGINLHSGEGVLTNSTVEKNLIQNNRGSGIYLTHGGTAIMDNTIRWNRNGTDVIGNGIMIDGGWLTFLYSNTACENEGTDIVDTGNASATFGDDNTCDTTDNYSDEGTRGCIFYCGGASGVCVGETYNFSCGMVVNESCRFNRSMNCMGCGGDGLIAGADGITIDGAGYTITGNFSDTGVFSNRTDVTIKNLQTKDFSTGIKIEKTIRNTIENCNVRKNRIFGIGFAADYGTLRNSRIYDNDGSGVAAAGNYNLFLNNTAARNRGYGFYFSPYACGNNLTANAIGDNDAGDICNYENLINATNVGDDNTCDTTLNYRDDSPDGMKYDGCTYPWTPPDLIIFKKSEYWVDKCGNKSYKVKYGIENIEKDPKSREACQSTTDLSINLHHEADDQVDPLQYGESQNKTFDYIAEMHEDNARDRIKVRADCADCVLENNYADIFHCNEIGCYTVKELWEDKETNNCRENTFKYDGDCKPDADQGAACVADDGTEYFGGDTVMKSCTLNGDMGCPAGTPGLIIGRNGITIDGNGSAIIGNVTPADCDWGAGAAPCTISGIYNAGYDNVEIINLEVVGFCTGIALSGTKKNIIESCDIHANGFDTNSPDGTMVTHGIHLCRVSDTKIYDNHVYYNKGTGCMCGDGGNGIFLEAGGRGYHGNVIEKNDLYYNDKAGFWTKQGMKHAKITDNTVYGNGDGSGVTDTTRGGIVLRCTASDYNTINGNTVRDNYGSGIIIGGSYNNITDNTVEDNAEDGITMNRCDGGSYYNKLCDNRVCGNGGTDIWTCKGRYRNHGSDNTCDTATEDCAWCAHRCSRKPDLRITRVTPEWKNPDNPEDDGYKYDITYTIENIGDADASGSTAGIWVGDADEYPSVPKLLVNGSYTGTVGPYTMSETCVEIEVCADSENVTDEHNKNNNCLKREWCALPDLNVTQINVSEEISMIFPNDATATIKNDGDVKTEKKFNVALFVNGDSVYAVTVPSNLAVGKSIDVTLNWASALELNDLRVFADSKNVIPESDEINNNRTVSIGEDGGNGTGDGPGNKPHIDPGDGVPLEDLVQPGEVNTGEGVGGSWDYDETIGNESVSGRVSKERVSAQLFRSNPFFGAVKEVVVSYRWGSIAIAGVLLLLFYFGYRGEIRVHRRNGR